MRIRWLITGVTLALAGCEMEQSGPESTTKPVAAIRITPERATVEVGDSIQITAEPRTASGELRLDAAVLWVTADTSALSLRSAQQSAWVKVKATGTLRVEARSEGKTATADITSLIVRPPNPVPVLTVLEPAFADAGAKSATISIKGTEFTPASVVSVNGAQRATTFIDANHLQFTMNEVDLAYPGEAQIIVSTPGPGGGRSADRTFTIYGPAVSVSIALTPGVLWVGERLQLRAVALDIHGRELLHRKVRWQSHDPGTASVDSSGIVTPLKRGATQVNGWMDDSFGPTLIAVIETPAEDLMYESSRGGKPELWRITPGPNAMPRRVLSEGVTAMDPAVSRARRIAFVGIAEGNPEIFVADANGTNLRRLTFDSNVDDQPTWSPDGSRIAFRSRRSGYSDIWIMNADGSGQRNLTDALNRVGKPAAQNATWSPDGSRIVFELADENVVTGGSQLYQVSPSGAGLRQLTTNAAARYYSPEFSPDGTVIMVRRYMPNFHNHVWFINANGSDDRPMAQVFGPGYAAGWSQDGKWIAYYSDPFADGSSRIVVSDLWYRKDITDFGGGKNPVWVRR